VSELDLEDLSHTAAGWTSILGYYASTQRQDPRGSVERFPDQHAAGWQLIDMRGRWWAGERIVFAASQLPGGFRQSLATAGHKGSAAIGWPMTVLEQSTGVTCLPGLLLPVNWVLDDASLTVTVDPVSPVINPAWLRAVRRRRGITEEKLVEAILGSDEGNGLDAVAPRLAHATAAMGGAVLRPADLAREMSMAGEGVRNAAALILPDEAAFTRRVADDLERIRRWEKNARQTTALGALVEGTVPSGDDVVPLVPPLPLSDLQSAAAQAALAGPITAIQGPPGTGKSQTIVSLIATAIATGRSVLFVARNHRALDEVERRLTELFPGIPVVVRGRDADGERDTSFLDAMREIANGSTGDAREAAAAARQRDDLLRRMEELASGRRVAARRQRLHLDLSELAERQVVLHDAVPPRSRARRSGWWVRLRLFLSRAKATRPLAETASLAEIEARMVVMRRELAALPDAVETDTVVAAEDLRQIARATVLPDGATISLLRQRLQQIDFEPSGAKVASLTPEDARLVLRHRPVWAVSSLSVPARVPLVPSLFDLAIFDEASQADIASSLPVMARARRVVVVGDPQQLSFIPALGRAQEHALMDAAGMPKSGRAGWAQSINSLFDFTAARVPADAVTLLADQFRSAPAIVDYTGAAFYGGRLVARREDDDFRPPTAYKSGLHWEDVRGTPTREDGGNINRAEAEHIIAKLVALTKDARFEGSVGVISPFNAQVGLIRRLADGALSSAARDRISLHVGTVDTWQGGEADVVFFSLVAGRGAASTAQSFLSRERRRFNVAISRARAVAVVVGDLDWARTSGIAHVADLADRATQAPAMPPVQFDSLWERRMAEALRRRGLDAQPQYPVGRRRLDFALFHGTVKLDVEVDGVRFHTGSDGGRKTADRLRDREMNARGWKVRRFWVWELQNDMEGCLDDVERDLGRR
jgi:very-short-patch-repair endonuclease